MCLCVKYRSKARTKPRRISLAGPFAAFLLAAHLAVSAHESSAEAGFPKEPTSLTVSPGQAEVRRYSREPRTVIVGDPKVAAASIANPDILVLTGLETGKTTVIVLDDKGSEIDHIALRVAEPGSMIVVRRGQERELLRCDPTCAPLDELGLAAPASRPVDPSPDIDSPTAAERTPRP